MDWAAPAQYSILALVKVAGATKSLVLTGAIQILNVSSQHAFSVVFIIYLGVRQNVFSLRNVTIYFNYLDNFLTNKIRFKNPLINFVNEAFFSRKK